MAQTLQAAARFAATERTVQIFRQRSEYSEAIAAARLSLAEAYKLLAEMDEMLAKGRVMIKEYHRAVEEGS